MVVVASNSFGRVVLAVCFCCFVPWFLDWMDGLGFWVVGSARIHGVCTATRRNLVEECLAVFLLYLPVYCTLGAFSSFFPRYKKEKVLIGWRMTLLSQIWSRVRRKRI